MIESKSKRDGMDGKVDLCWVELREGEEVVIVEGGGEKRERWVESAAWNMVTTSS